MVKSRPSIDHSALSPSGKTSKRARKAALKRTRRELFGDGLPFPTCRQETASERLRRQAADLRDLAARGMRPRSFIRQAENLESQAQALELDK